MSDHNDEDDDLYWSSSATRWMTELGNFSPTVNVENRCVKGHLADGRTYFDSDELRSIAKACNEVADWLDNRAKENG